MHLTTLPSTRRICSSGRILIIRRAKRRLQDFRSAAPFGCLCRLAGRTHFEKSFPHGKHIAAILAPDETKLKFTHLTFLLNFFDELHRRVPEGKK